MSEFDLSEQDPWQHTQRLHSISPSDPISGYYGYPEVQETMLAFEAIVAGISDVAVEELSPEVTSVFAAAERLSGIMEPTPVKHSPAFTNELGIPVWLKREDTTEVFSFKLRGAYNKIAQLTEEERKNSILAASAGNHAQGVALAAKKLGIEATIVMPKSTPDVKIEAVEGMGATVILEGDSYTDAYNYSQQILTETDPNKRATFIHPFNDEEVIAGQGTVGLEILRDLPDVTHIFVPIGGGGLIAGIAQTVKYLRPDVKVIGVQTTESNAMHQSWLTGERVTLDHVGVFADGVAVKEVGDIAFRLVQEYVDDIVVVTTDQICGAMDTFKRENRTDLEPAGALSLAGMRVYVEEHGVRNDQVFVPITSGANVSPEALSFAIERAEIARNREALFAIKLREVPGALRQLCADVINGHNITQFHYRFTSEIEAHILVGFTTKDKADKARFLESLAQHSYEAYDFSDSEFVRDHIHALSGGRAWQVSTELIYEIEFPERAGALLEFLEELGDHWNISLFEYQRSGTNTGKVLIGFEEDYEAGHETSVKELEAALKNAAQSYTPIDSAAAKIFL